MVGDTNIHFDQGISNVPMARSTAKGGLDMLGQCSVLEYNVFISRRLPANTTILDDGSPDPGQEAMGEVFGSQYTLLPSASEFAWSKSWNDMLLRCFSLLVDSRSTMYAT